MNCPVCGSSQVYNSGFTIECDTYGCSNYTAKQDLAIALELTSDLEKELNSLGVNGSREEAKVTLCIVGARDAAACVNRGDVAEASVVTEVHYFNARAEWLLGQIKGHEAVPQRETNEEFTEVVVNSKSVRKIDMGVFISNHPPLVFTVKKLPNRS